MYPATLEVIAKCQLKNDRKKVVIDTFAAGVKFDPGTTYTIDLEQDFVKETEGSKFSNPAVTGLGTFTTNSTGPQVQTDEPTDGGTNILNNTFIRYTYDRQLLAGDGNYYLYKVGSPDVLLQTYNPSDSTANNTISGNQITLNTTGFIDAGETYYVLIDEGAVEDRDGLAAFGFNNDQEHRWTTAPSTNVDFPDLSAAFTDAFTPTMTANAVFQYAVLTSLAATQTATPVKTTDTGSNIQSTVSKTIVPNFTWRSATMDLQGAFSPTMLVGAIFQSQADLTVNATLAVDFSIIIEGASTMSSAFTQSAIDGNLARIRFVDASMSSVFEIDHQTNLQFISSSFEAGYYPSYQVDNNIALPTGAQQGDYAIIIENGTIRNHALTNGFGFLYSTEEATGNTWPGKPQTYNKAGYKASSTTTHTELISDTFGSAYVDPDPLQQEINYSYTYDAGIIGANSQDGNQFKPYYNFISYKKLTQQDINNGELTLASNNTTKQILIFRDQDDMFSHIQPVAYTPENFGESQTVLSNELPDSTTIKAPVVFLNIQGMYDYYRNSGTNGSIGRPEVQTTITTDQPGDTGVLRVTGAPQTYINTIYAVQNRTENAQATFTHGLRGVPRKLELNITFSDYELFWPKIFDGSVSNYTSYLPQNAAGPNGVTNFNPDRSFTGYTGDGQGALIDSIQYSGGDFYQINIGSAGYNYKWNERLGLSYNEIPSITTNSNLLGFPTMIGLGNQYNEALLAIQFVGAEAQVDEIQMPTRALLQCSPD